MKPNRRLGLVFFSVAVVMAGASFAAVPFYRLFCQMTGYGGTPRIVPAAQAAPSKSGKTITVRFNADVAKDMPWRFAPEQASVTLPLGESGLAFFSARNMADRAITGQAVYNVTPNKAARYFNKTQCFCFVDYRLGPGQKADLPVSFYVDPRIAQDPETEDVRTITLSYTFFKAKEDAP